MTKLRLWLWYGFLASVGVVLAATLGLIIALTLGWNNPRPGRPPDWALAGAQVLRASANETAKSLLGYSGSDFTFEAIAHPIAAPSSGFYGYGLIYRAQDAAHFYAFAIGGDGYYTVLRRAGEEDVPLVEWQQFPHIRRDERPNRLRVICAGASCRFYVNDEYVTSVEDTTWLEGDFGLWVRGFDEDVTVRFEDLRVWEKIP